MKCVSVSVCVWVFSIEVRKTGTMDGILRLFNILSIRDTSNNRLGPTGASEQACTANDHTALKWGKI